MAHNDQPWFPPEKGFYMTDAITDTAVSFIEKAVEEKEPFFMYLAYTAPHWPLHALPEDIKKYEGKYMMGWEELRIQRFEKQKKLGLIDSNTRLSPIHPDVPKWESLDEDKKKLMDRKMAVYAAQIECMDRGIGKIMHLLKAKDEAENTVVMFLSDNGACAESGAFGTDFFGNNAWPGGEDSYQSYGLAWANASNTPYRWFKQYTHEGGIRTPFILSFPKSMNAPGRFEDTPCHIFDIMSTCIEIAGTEYPATFNDSAIINTPGRSFYPLIEGNKIDNHDVLFFEHQGNKAVIEGDMKIVSLNKERWELYNLKEDPSELNNLAWKYYWTATRPMDSMYSVWAEKTGVLPYPFPEAEKE
jgi:arylsulfatase